MTLAEERAARGAAWYDARMPGWADRINLGRLSICHTGDCIRGQLEGEAPPAVFQATSPEDDEVYPFDYGFDAEWRIVTPEEQEAAWAAEVRKRRTP